MKSNAKTKQLVLLSLFAAIEVILMLTPLGYIPIGPIRATTLHIPVILAGILLGKKTGAIVGFVFGLTSLLINTFQPTVTSFVFSPFATFGEYSGNFASLWIAFGPRILLGFLSGFSYDLIKNRFNRSLSAALVAIANTLIHTLLVMGSIYIFFGSAYAAARGIVYDELIAVIFTVITTNGVIEAILAGFLVPAVCKALKPLIKER